MSDVMSAHAHHVAHRRLRTIARERGCFVVCDPDNRVIGDDVERMDCYRIIDIDSGTERGSFRAPPRGMTREHVDEFFSKGYR